jgi:hypothetical protein
MMDDCIKQGTTISHPKLEWRNKYRYRYWKKRKIRSDFRTQKNLISLAVKNFFELQNFSGSDRYRTHFKMHFSVAGVATYPCSGSVTFWYRSVSLDPFTWFTDTDPAPDPALFVCGFQDAKKRFFSNLFGLLISVGGQKLHDSKENQMKS